MGTTTLIISNKETNDIMKIIKFLEESSLLIKGVSKAIEYEAKWQKGRSMRMILDTLGPSLLGNMLARVGDSIIQAGEGKTRDA